MSSALIRESLLAWYRANARVLPWRRDSNNPYRVWVSEIMLQQTRVDTVIPYYQRFMTELPTLQELAAVPEAKLLKLWEGLGYYGRARNLQKAARLILEKYQGKVPDSVADLLTLPGIGEYTAGAIASIAFGKNSPAIDGNVLRVICRLTENRGDIRTAETKSAIRAFLQKLYPTEHCGDFTQSLMELGATVCRPNGLPLCECCPIAAFCQSHRHGSALQIPVKAQKKARKIEKMTVLLLHADGKIAIRRRPDKGLLAGLWEFPMLPGWPTKRALSASLQKNGLEVAALSETLRVRHIFSHLEWHMRGWHADCTGKAPDLLWVTPQEINTRITLPTAFQAFKNLLLSPLLGFNASSSPIPFANETRR